MHTQEEQYDLSNELAPIEYYDEDQIIDETISPDDDQQQQPLNPPQYGWIATFEMEKLVHDEGCRNGKLPTFYPIVACIHGLS